MSHYNRAMLRLSLAGVYFSAMLVCFALTAPAIAQPADSPLQQVVTQAMAGRRGTAVILDVRSGRVLAAYHLEVAARRVAHPGSSIKPFTLMALLEAGKVDEHTALVCKRQLSIAGHKLDCSHPQTAQPLDPSAALAYSCNSYFANTATLLTPLQLHDSLVGDGFSSLTTLTPEEVAGNVAMARSPEQLQLQAIGEWGISVTPLELVSAYRKVALRQVGHDPKLAKLFAGLEQSVSYGMGREAQPAASMKVAGKTGTANADEGPWTHAWFAGYAPAQNPEIVLVVFLEKGHGGTDAAGVAREIFTAFADSRTSSVVQRVAGAQP